MRARTPALEKVFKGKSSAAYSKTANPLMTMEHFVQLMVDRTVAKDVIVHPTPNVAGTLVPDVHSNLSWLDAKGAFVTAQTRDDKQAAKQTLKRGQQDVNTTMTFDEFYMCVALCGHKIGRAHV